MFQGKKHEYLGMQLDYSEPGEVKLKMIDYVKEILEYFPEEITGNVASPTGSQLFDV